MISETSSSVQGLMAAVSGKGNQAGQASQGDRGFLALLQGNAQDSDASVRGLLANLGGKGQANGEGSGSDMSRLRAALSGLATTAHAQNQGSANPAATEEELKALADALVNLSEQLQAHQAGTGNGDNGNLPSGLLQALSNLTNGKGNEDALEAVSGVLDRLQQRAAEATPDQSTQATSEDLDQLQDLNEELAAFMQRLDGQTAPTGEGGAESLQDQLAQLSDSLARLQQAGGPGDSGDSESLTRLQEQLGALRDVLGEPGADINLKDLLNAAPQVNGETTRSIPSLPQLTEKLAGLLDSLKAARPGAQAGAEPQTMPAAKSMNAASDGKTNPQEEALPTAARGQEAARDGEQSSRQAGSSPTAELQEEAANRQKTGQALSDKQAAELYESLRQAGKTLQNEVAARALERSLARLSEQAGGMNRLAEALSSLQGREDSLTSSSGSRGPESLNALSFESQLRNAGQAQQASLQAQQAAKSQGGPAADQIAMKIHKAAAAGKERISVQLHPAELGRVDVKLEFSQDGLLRASITTERPETLDLLQRDVRALERALGDAGVKTDSGSLNFNTRDTAGQHQAFDGQQGQSGESGSSSPTANNGNAPDLPDEGDDAPWHGGGHGLINLSV
ncbi:flagellar hook-length control protein FliK [Fodinicurvata halophila]|uniref:Flagellar hook-length control protein FliK n=1 Tax=Fodinicurvata halophila TaxID=1419723 RepID=A0ABV8UKW8_9PROT